jgi:hypothetical protein
VEAVRYYLHLVCQVPGLLINGTGLLSAAGLLVAYCLAALGLQHAAEAITSLSPWWLIPIGLWVLGGLLRANWEEVRKARKAAKPTSAGSAMAVGGGNVSQSGNVIRMDHPVFNVYPPPVKKAPKPRPKRGHRGGSSGSAPK